MDRVDLIINYFKKSKVCVGGGVIVVIRIKLFEASNSFVARGLIQAYVKIKQSVWREESP